MISKPQGYIIFKAERSASLEQSPASINSGASPYLSASTGATIITTVALQFVIRSKHWQFAFARHNKKAANDGNTIEPAASSESSSKDTRVEHERNAVVNNSKVLTPIIGAI